jgi:ATP-dependent DNA helicase RecG
MISKPNLNTPLKDTKIIPAFYLKKFEKLGIKTAKDMILYFPRRYNDFTNLAPIANVSVGQVATIQGKILKIKSISIFRRHINITEALVEDGSGIIKAVWFNQPYLAKVLAEGANVSLSGKIDNYKKGMQISNPMYEKMDEPGDLTHTGRLVPVYSETAGLTSRYIRKLIKGFLSLGREIPDILPEEIKKRRNFLSIRESINEIHFPSSKEKLEASKKRLAFEELFVIQLASMRQKASWQKRKAIKIPFNKELIQRFVKNLSFKLTDDQRRAAWDILKDLEKPYPMNRLLLGDVGSGKTVVALIAALQAASRGLEAAFMAPTEILAFQHFGSVVKMLAEQNIAIGLLTGSMAKIYSGSGKTPQNISRASLAEKIAGGQIGILIGTHSLIQKEIEQKKLALAIIDEQHRFGVRQRGQFLSGGKKRSREESSVLLKLEKYFSCAPHILSMSATPIPRTLALAFYGTMDISVIREMPRNRKKIITKVVSPADRIKAYEFIKKQIQKGKQAFIVCPLVEGTEANQSRAAVREYNRLEKYEFRSLSLGLLHGRLKPAEKDFANGAIDILVSTSVVEVGVDVPNATVMMIEGAEHFGLAELHQFRGRVGRSSNQSYCLLFTDSGSEETIGRLKAMEKTSDGFELAKEDLKQRGPGEFLGIGQIQSGFPDLKIADLTDEKTLKTAREEAEKLLAADFELKAYPLLADRLEKYKTQAKEK